MCAQAFGLPTNSAEEAFVQILLLARTMGFLNLGKISLDGSKVKANASKHSALSWGHATELEEQLKAEEARLMEMAAAADADVPEGMDIPSELKRREDRLKAIAAAKVKLEARAAERHSSEQAEYEAKMAKRKARAKEIGKRPGGRAPKAPEPGVRKNDQINLTDEESRIMPAGGKSFQQAYNAQAGVDTETMLVVTEYVTPHANDKQEIEPALQALKELAEPLGPAEAILADTGYYSEANVRACQAAGVTPYITSPWDGIAIIHRWNNVGPNLRLCRPTGVRLMPWRIGYRPSKAGPSTANASPPSNRFLESLSPSWDSGSFT